MSRYQKAVLECGESLKMAKRRAPKSLIDKFSTRARKLSNSARYDVVLNEARQHLKVYPDDVTLLYYIAVFEAEDDSGLSQAQKSRRHSQAARKLKALLPRLRGRDLLFRSRIRNEYYWFSHQPLKQYQLGREMVSKGLERSYYSQGVGAIELAELYLKKGKRRLALRWAKKSEKAWLRFFQVDAQWFNSYFFYATALGIQGREKEMQMALEKARVIAGRPKGWIALREMNEHIARLRSLI